MRRLTVTACALQLHLHKGALHHRLLQMHSIRVLLAYIPYYAYKLQQSHSVHIGTLYMLCYTLKQEGDRITSCHLLANAALAGGADGFNVQEVGLLTPAAVRTRALWPGQVLLITYTLQLLARAVTAVQCVITDVICLA
jgi:hypothetical protein